MVDELSAKKVDCLVKRDARKTGSYARWRCRDSAEEKGNVLTIPAALGSHGNMSFLRTSSWNSSDPQWLHFPFGQRPALTPNSLQPYSTPCKLFVVSGITMLLDFYSATPVKYFSTWYSQRLLLGLSAAIIPAWINNQGRIKGQVYYMRGGSGKMWVGCGVACSDNFGWCFKWKRYT